MAYYLSILFLRSGSDHIDSNFTEMGSKEVIGGSDTCQGFHLIILLTVWILRSHTFEHYNIL